MSKPTPKYTYKLKRSVKDPEKMVFQKFGLTAEFTLRDAHVAITEAKKQKVDAENRKRLFDAHVENVERNHPDVVKLVKSLKGVKGSALEVYVKNKIESNKAAAALKESTKILKRLEAEVREVKKQHNIK